MYIELVMIYHYLKLVEVASLLLCIGTSLKAMLLVIGVIDRRETFRILIVSCGVIIRVYFSLFLISLPNWVLNFSWFLKYAKTKNTTNC